MAKMLRRLLTLQDALYHQSNFEIIFVTKGAKNLGYLILLRDLADSMMNSTPLYHKERSLLC